MKKKTKEREKPKLQMFIPNIHGLESVLEQIVFTGEWEPGTAVHTAAARQIILVQKEEDNEEEN